MTSASRPSTGSPRARCRSWRPEPPELLKKVLASGRLEMSADGSILERTSQIVVVIGTPVDEFLGPSMTVFERAVNQISPHLQPGSLVVLRSTVYPGTTGYVGQRLRDLGHDADVAFCPERIAEGHALEELRTLPQIVGADDDRPPNAQPPCSSSSGCGRSGRPRRRPSSPSCSPTPGGT